ncbi:MAG: cobalamin biosynthesis protein [Candidatus Scalindua rubra]|uniref:Cobalamin biosynthesis protein n=1 Tax=Candidatus Scalindua brodae TaxID=237368 RepID=A0A0B0EK41_9BACT|nr:MAG: cobalamin biosynthesis protein [Candidatus Scalindua brodae]MBZ0108116.1 cobalamin biosynthesis protein [Candidatus Scalindua rubra]TWU31265.1 cobalamin biosynthesis protein CbiG [Candidatus Brocadiaceae bacterium S225]
MKLALTAITNDGINVAKRIKEKLDCEVTVFLPQKLMQTNLEATYYSRKFGDQIAELFSHYEGFIFIMASGIVVRTIAPHITDKYTDPAVVVVDDVGRFVISLLSGHEGGANNLAHNVANILHTDAVITTGTEAQKDIIIGMGCKRGIGSNEVKDAINRALAAAEVSINRVRLAGTVDLKADEVGLLCALEELGIPLRVVSRSEIDTCAKDYSKSDFVIEKIGVGGVAEPAALISGRKTKLILKRQTYPGITVAIAQENFSW